MNMYLYKNLKLLLMAYIIIVQQIHKKQEILLLQQLGYLFAENPITDFRFWGLNKHIFISDNFEIVINVNGYISITDDEGTVWYQGITESPAKLPYARPVLDFNWNEINVDSIINSFTSEVDLHRFMELLEVEMESLKQRLWLLNNTTLKLEFIEDDRLIQELAPLREVA